MSIDLTSNPYVQDILAQPQALRDTVELLRSTSLDSVVEAIEEGKVMNIVLTGMGSSLHALHPLLITLRTAGLSSDLIETSELLYYHTGILESDTLVIAVSQSGSSAEIVRLLDEAYAPTLGVTNTPDSPLAERADAVVMIRAGTEYSVSCKTYLTSLAALAWIGEVLTEGDANAALDAIWDAADAMESYLGGWQSHVQNFMEQLHSVQHVTLAGRGPSLATVHTGALILKESAHIPSEGLSSAGFRHGPLDMVSEKQFVMVFGGPDATRALNNRLVADIQGFGGRALLISEDSPKTAARIAVTNEIARPILEFLPVEMLSLALAQLNGHNPGVFERATKVTTTE